LIHKGFSCGRERSDSYTAGSFLQRFRCLRLDFSRAASPTPESLI